MNFEDKMDYVLNYLFEDDSPHYNTFGGYMRNKYNSLMGIYKILASDADDTTKINQAIEKAIPFIKRVAYQKSNSNVEPDYEVGRSERYTPSDYDDLVQLGRIAVYNYITKNQTGIISPKKFDSGYLGMAIKSMMNRGGHADYRLSGDIPYQMGDDAYRSAKEDPTSITTIDHDYDINQIEQPPNLDKDYEMASRAIDKADISPKTKQYFRDVLGGATPADVAKKYGTSRMNISQTMYKNKQSKTPKVRPTDKKNLSNLEKIQNAVDESIRQIANVIEN